MSRSLALAFLLALASVSVSPRTHAAEPVSPERLHRDLEQGARLFRQDPDAGSAAAYAGRLSWVDVEWEGRTITVRDPWLTDAVAGLQRVAPEDRKERLKEIGDHLAARASQVDREGGAALAEGAGQGEPLPPPPTDPNALLEGILDQQQFQPPEEDLKLAEAAAKLRDRVRSGWSSLKSFVSRIFEGPNQDQGFWGIVRWIATLTLAVAGLSLLVWFVVRTLVRAAVDSASHEEEPDMPESPPLPAEMTAEARRLSATGDLRGAVRALYLALLGRLHEQGTIVYDRHRTNREYLRSMRASGGQAESFSRVVEVFDRKWYGKEPCSPEEVRTFEETVLRAGERSSGDRAA